MATKKKGGDLTAVIDFIFDEKKLKQFEKKFNSIVKGVKKFEKTGKRAMDVVNQSTQKATRETEQYQHELQTVNRELSKMGKLGSVAKKAMGFGVVGAGIAGFVAKRAVDKEIEMSRVARQVKTTTALMRALDTASAKTGLTFSQMSDMIKEISISTGDALEGSGSSFDAFKALGYTQAQVKALSESKDQGKAFLKVINDIQKSGKSISQQSWIADGIFKGEGDALIGSLQGFKDFSGEITATAGLMADTTEATKELTNAMFELKKLFGVLTTGLLKENADLFKMFANSLAEVSKNIKQEDITKFMTEMKNTLKDIKPWMEFLIRHWEILLSLGIGAKIFSATTALLKMGDAIMKSTLVTKLLVGWQSKMSKMTKASTVAINAETTATNANTLAKKRNALAGLGKLGKKAGILGAVLGGGLAVGKGLSMLSDQVTGGNRSARFNEGLKYLASGEFLPKASDIRTTTVAEARARRMSQERIAQRAQTNNNYATNNSQVQIHVDSIDSNSIDQYTLGGN